LLVVVRLRRAIVTACVMARFSTVERTFRWISLDAGRNVPRIIVDAICVMMAVQLTEEWVEHGEGRPRGLVARFGVKKAGCWGLGRSQRKIKIPGIQN